MQVQMLQMLPVTDKCDFTFLPHILVCFVVEFDLLFVFGVLSCWILDSTLLFILYVHEHDHLSFGMLTVETAVFDCICWFSSSRDRKVQSYLVEYCLEAIEEYSEGKIHNSELEPQKRKCKYCVLCLSGQEKYSNQLHGVCLRWMSTQLQMFIYNLSFLLRTMFAKKMYFYKWENI